MSTESQRAGSKARLVAVRVLDRVARDAAYASLALDAEAKRAGLDPRDAALATELVYGTLRRLPSIDRAIDASLDRPGSKLDAWVRASLRVGAHQLLHLDRIPAHAAVDEAVSIVRVKRGPRMGGLVNAVLRRIASGSKPGPDDPASMELPAWMEEAIVGSIGRARYDLLVALSKEPPSLDLRVLGDDADVDALREAIERARPGARVLRGSIGARTLRVWGAGDPRTLPGHAEGLFSVQEQGAQWIAESVGARPGERIADLCAGHGTKTLALAREVGPAGEVVAVDLHAHRLDALEAERRRLGIAASVRVETIDLSVGLGGLPEGGFDRVLVDAPCTGLGTVQRRPELSARIAPANVRDLHVLQSKILDRAIRLVRPGGVLVYAVCSPLAAEGVDVVAEVSEGGAMAPDPPAAPPPDLDGMVRLGPWLGGPEARTDAYQVWRARRAGPPGSLR